MFTDAEMKCEGAADGDPSSRVSSSNSSRVVNDVEDLLKATTTSGFCYPTCAQGKLKDDYTFYGCTPSKEGGMNCFTYDSNEDMMTSLERRRGSAAITAQILTNACSCDNA